MDLKEFRYPDADPDYANDPKWDMLFSVLAVKETTVDAPKYVINAHDGHNSITVYPGEVDRYIEIFEYIKQRENTNNDE